MWADDSTLMGRAGKYGRRWDDVGCLIEGGTEKLVQQTEAGDAILDCVKEAKTRPILILGDFNAAHTQWGYKYSSKRGKQLAKALEDHDMMVVNEPGVPTRTGTGTARDTTPDLTLVRGTSMLPGTTPGRTSARTTT
ncbi:hypothetical protein HPB48_008056 [Haemaphysalis longicornis]|uniref:Endonuclease/exonuclease/phosphatase domain-containing protein n=1 Tax=Haemaphysalis longicornis TaxID=44386 RepID=A0A9J6H1G4_HAELO|nr:hypothetical protein HPB48_008056 [Haemaphysalis longicornis]